MVCLGSGLWINTHFIFMFACFSDTFDHGLPQTIHKNIVITISACKGMKCPCRGSPFAFYVTTLNILKFEHHDQTILLYTLNTLSYCYGPYMVVVICGVKCLI